MTNGVKLEIAGQIGVVATLACMHLAAYGAGELADVVGSLVSQS
jgi:hypothetical protein